MKTSKLQNTLLAALFLILGLISNLTAQANSISDITKNVYALDNLKSGINSENTGVRKCSIYFAGKYKIREVVSTLIERLEKENEPSVRLLIAYSLYEIKEDEGMKAVNQLSLKDKNSQVKRMSYNLYKEYVDNLNRTAAL
ncbi:MAG TPA: hypothetical protein DHV28_07195 [Ignavibacteriales bacterium]|nr:hypothetical protein [Ignavibacteriales bacterium]